MIKSPAREAKFFRVGDLLSGNECRREDSNLREPGYPFNSLSERGDTPASTRWFTTQPPLCGDFMYRRLDHSALILRV